MAYARELSIQYGEITVGGRSTKYLLTDVHTIEQGFVSAVVEFVFVCVGTTESSFAANCQDVEEAFRTPDLDLVIRNGGATLLAWKQSENTGLDAVPRIVKRGDVADTNRSRLYVVRVEVGLPGGRASVDGLRQKTVSVSYDPSRRRHVTISGEFTAFTSAAARAQYEAKIDSLCSSALTALTGTFELAEEDALSTTNDKSATFRRVYDEVIYDQAGGGVGNVNIVRQQMTVSRNESRSSPMTEPAQPWVVSTVTYEAWVDKTRTTDLEGQWTSIRSFAISKAQDAIGGGGNAVLMSEEPRYDRDNNRITATLILGAAASEAQDLIAYVLTVTDECETGKVFVPVWVKGRPLSRYKYQGPMRYRRTVSETVTKLSEQSLEDFAHFHHEHLADARGKPRMPAILTGAETTSGEWEIVSPSCGWSPRVVGLSSNSRPVVEWTARTVLELVEIVAAVTGGTGGNQPPVAVTGGSGATVP